MIGVIDSRALWYLTRGTGIAALLLLTVSLAVGVLDSARWSSIGYPRALVAGVHRYASLLVVAFIVLHVATSVVDGFAPIRWLDAVVPFHARYRSLWLGFGALAFDLIVALVATSLLRRRIGNRIWRLVHWLAYACWPLALLHALGAGSDVHDGWLVAVSAVCLAATVGCVALRIARAGGAVARTSATVAMVGLIVGVELWTLAGPMQQGWARRAGTPGKLLATVARPHTRSQAHGGIGAPRATSTTVPRALATAPFSVRITGTARESAPNSQGTVRLVIDGTLRDGSAGTFDVSIEGTQIAGGGLHLTASSVTLAAANGSDAYHGRTIGVNGADIDTAVRRADGRAMQVLFRLSITHGGVVSGVAQARSISWNG